MRSPLKTNSVWRHGTFLGGRLPQGAKRYQVAGEAAPYCLVLRCGRIVLICRPSVHAACMTRTSLGVVSVRRRHVMEAACVVELDLTLPTSLASAFPPRHPCCQAGSRIAVLTKNKCRHSVSRLGVSNGVSALETPVSNRGLTTSARLSVAVTCSLEAVQHEKTASNHVCVAISMSLRPSGPR